MYEIQSIFPARLQRFTQVRDFAGRCLLWWGGLILVLSLSGCFSKTSSESSESGTVSRGALSKETWLSREALKNRCLALLENGAENDKEGAMLREATEGFRKIAKENLTDKLGVQNLCVALLLQMKKPGAVDNEAVFSASQKEFEAAIINLRRLAPDEPDADVLACRFHLIKNEREQAIESLRLACKKTNATADTFYQLYHQLQTASIEDNLAEKEAAIRSALKLTPSNLKLAVALLECLVNSKKPEYKTEVERCREMFRPLVARTSSVIPKLLDAGLAAVEKGDWKAAENQTGRLRNVLLPELAFQNDMHQLDPHDLEYIQLVFNDRTPTLDATRNAATKSTWKFALRETLSFASKGVSAIASEDIDLDGHADLVLANGKQLEVWKAPKDQDAQKLLVAALNIECAGIVLADLDHDYQRRKDSLPPSALPTTAPPDANSADNQLAAFLDTDVDVVVYGREGIRLYRNDLDAATGTRTLNEMPQASAMASLVGVRAAATIDFDHDSDLDLIVSSESGVSLWSNRGDWTFADFTSFSSMPDASTKIDSILAMDLDRNVLNDFLLGTDDSETPIWLSNNLHGRYHPTNLNWKSGVQGACRAVEAIDANQDACWDILSCGKLGTKLTTMKSVGKHGWIPDQVAAISTTAMTGLIVSDWDFDGFSDCIAWGSSGLELYRGGPDGKLLLDRTSLVFSESSMQVVSIDIDRDGDDDLVCLTSKGEARLFENDGGNSNQHIEVVLRADEDGKQRPRERCNMHGIGGLIELKSGGRYQPQIVRGTRTKFGIGQETGAEVTRVVWTNGIPNNILNAKNKCTVFDQQNLGGSCPYLYAWNGERFEFCTDCLWAAPIGLQFAQGVSAPCREWEYLKIDGGLLKPRDGKYVLQITEELWEAAYFDAVELMAVDHPAEVEIFTNEKVGPAELADFQVHTVRNRLPPRSVIDQRGNDLTELVSKRDQRYTKCWNEGFNQGLVEQHWLEVDLNSDADSKSDASRSDDIKLFLTGWVFPTCTSLNLAMTENPLRPKLSPPSIQVPDANGEWLEVIPYAGFPGGKTKTIVIDLTGKFLSNDHRVRVVTNMELCWDEVFWANSDRAKNPDDYRLTKLELVSAHLHYRGFSELVPQPGNAPKRFVYDRVTQESIWPPMSGNFTRFGDVGPLITEPDDMQVVMGAGDEMTVEFSAGAKELPEGWKRDFIIYNVGWDKDADLNTVHGQSVEPLPFRNMSKYPYEPEQTFPNESKHIDFLKRYQTRLQSHGLFWNQVREN